MNNQNVGGGKDRRSRKDARFLLAGSCIDGRGKNRVGKHRKGAVMGRGGVQLWT